MRGTFVVALALAATVIAAPNRMRKVNALNKRATTVTDIDPVVLNYALTLEHLEAAFYAQALSQFSADDFANAGYPDWVRYRLTEIAAHEAQHVALLSGALTAAGANATEACTYEFGLTSPASVLATAQVLEGVGVSAYTGAAALITSADYLTVAASILAVEARHSSWIRGAAQAGMDSFPAAYDTPLGLNNVYSLAAPFFTGCPVTNPALPVTAFPSLTVAAGPYFPGQQIAVSGGNSTDTSFGVFLSGLGQSVSAVVNGQVTIPNGLFGQVYLVLTNANATASDENTIAGPAVIEIPLQATLF